MLKIGLTGGIGSGKTVVADRFAQHGIAVIDTDAIAHQITAPNGSAMPAIAAQFGAEFVDSSGALDRARMRALVFADPIAKRRLEAITHPLIRAECERATLNSSGPYLVLVVPLLVESGTWASRVDRVLVVDCSEARQIERVIQRNGFARAQVEAIMAQQAGRSQRLAAAHDVIHNDEAGLEHVLKATDELHLRYLQLANVGTNAQTVAKTPPSS